MSPRERESPGAPVRGDVKSFNHDGTLLATLDAGDTSVWDVASGTKKYSLSNTNSVSFSSDLRTLAGAYNYFNTHEVRLWNVDSGEYIASLRGVDGRVHNTSFSPNGKTLAAGGADGKVYLWDVDAQTVRTVLIGHTDDVSRVSFSPDGNTLASGSDDRTVRLWDASTGGQIAILTGHIGRVNRVSFGRNGKTLASFSHEDGIVHKWDLATRIPKFTISGYGRLRGTQLDEPQDVIFGPDGKTLASIGSDDGAIYLWDVATGRERLSLNGCRVVGEDIRSMNFSPDGKTLASGGSDDMVRLWDVASGREIAVLKSPPPVQRVIFSPDGKTLAIHAGDNVHLWDVEARAEIVALTGHTGWVDSVSFSPDRDSKILAGINYDGDYNVRLWDIDTRAEIGALGRDYQSLRSVVFSPDGETLAAINSVGGMVHLWDVEARREIAVLPHASVQSVSFSPDKDSKIIATGGIDGPVRLWDVPTGTQIGEALAGHDNRVRNVVFSPDGKTLAGVGGERYGQHRLILWDVKARREIAVFTHLNHPSISFSPDSRTLASTGYDYDSVYLWDVPTGKKKNLMTTRNTVGIYYGAGVSFSPDSKTLASADGNDVRLWDVGTRRQIGEALTGHTQTVRSVSFSPDSKTLVSDGGDQTVRLWDVESRSQIAVLPHTQTVRSLSFSPDGKTLATIDDTSYVGEVRLWDVDTRTEIAVLPHAGVRNVSFSPDRDSRMLASDGIDGKVRLWDIDTDTEIAALQGPADFDARVSFSPDGKTLAAFSPETTDEVYYGVVYLWDVDTKEEIAVIRVRIAGPPIFSFSPDSRMLAFAEHGSSTVRLWDVEAGEEKPGFTTGFNPVDSMSFSPDGKTLATNYDGVVRLWNVATRIPKVTIREPEIRHSVPIFSPDGRTLVVFSVSRMFWLNVPASGSAEEGTRLAADVNGDGTVNIQDLVAVSAALGQTGENGADVNGDGEVNIQDMVAVAAALGDAAAAPSLIHPQLAGGLTAAEVAQWIEQAQSANLTDATSQRGIRFLHYLLAMLTPQETTLLPNYPNPFNPETWMPYRLAAPGDVTLTIRAVDGGMVRSLALGHQPAGVYQAKSRAAYWDGRNSRGEPVASGVYFYTLSAGDFSATRKMLIRK